MAVSIARSRFQQGYCAEPLHLDIMLLSCRGQSQHVSLKDSITRETRQRPLAKRQWVLPPKLKLETREPEAWTAFLVSSSLAQVHDDALKAKVELDDTLQHLHRAGGLPPNATKSDVSLHTCEETAGAWRQNLQFSLLRGGISSR